MASGLAILVATRDREPHLRRLLASVVALAGFDRVRPAVVVVDDGSTDGTAALARATAAAHPTVRHLAVPAGGKSRALNVAIRRTAAERYAFVDDDVALDPQWLVAIEAYGARHPAFAAAQGTIRIAPEAEAQPSVVAAIERWHTIPRCDYGPTAVEAPSLIGANMLIARRTFARVGLFDERLGPGAAGASEDTELALRIRAAGERIGYVADAIAYHAVEPDRLGPAYFRALHEARGRSRVHYKFDAHRSPLAVALRVFPDAARAAVGVALTSLGGRGEPHRRALARWYHYRAMLAAGRGARRSDGVPRLDDDT
ncbi:MAG: glycosyltransferase family 2 protein [Deltaproteobacteria bacterium]|nr:glycosyltransferase family 2 protein [Deltaproteobacteria bacterium]